MKTRARKNVLKRAILANKKAKLAGNPLRTDPTRTTGMVRHFCKFLDRQFDRLKADVLRAVGKEDWLGVGQPVENANPEGHNQYTVGVHKAYFPKELHPKGIGEEYLEVHKVAAKNRQEAADKVWAEHGERLLKMMLPANRLGRKVSLHVNEPRAGVGGKLGRLRPNLVHDESKPADEPTSNLYQPFVCNGEVGYFPSRGLIEVPDVRQPDSVSCGAAAAMSVGRYFGVGPENLGQWVKDLGTSEEGTHPEPIVQYLRGLGLRVEAFRHGNLDTLDHYLGRGWPVLCCVQDYGPKKSWEHGHYLVVIGHRDHYLFAQDPAMDNVMVDGHSEPISELGSLHKPGRVMITEEEFLQAWHDEDEHGVPYVRFGVAVGPAVTANYEDQPRDHLGRFTEVALPEGYRITEYKDTSEADTLHRLDIHKDGKNVAYLTAHPATDGGMWLKGMTVAKEHRGLGLAKAMFAHAVNKYGHEDISLRAKPYKDKPLKTKQLQAFYGQFGFVPTDREGRMLRKATPVANADVTATELRDSLGRWIRDNTRAHDITRRHLTPEEVFQASVHADMAHDAGLAPAETEALHAAARRWHQMEENEVTEAGWTRHGQLRVAARELHEALNRHIRRPIFKSEAGPPTDNTRWAFATSSGKLAQFGRWLRTRVANLISGRTMREAWRKYVEQGWRKGAARAFDDSHQRQKWERHPDTVGTDLYTGGREEFLRSSFNHPESVEKVQLLASRTYTDLDGVTTAMSTQMARTLTDGLTRGEHPYQVAAKLVKVVDGIGRKRARMVAQHNFIYAHSEGQLDNLERLGVEEVGVAVEFTVTPDNKLCPTCASLQNLVLKTRKAHGIIPLHPG